MSTVVLVAGLGLASSLVLFAWVRRGPPVRVTAETRRDQIAQEGGPVPGRREGAA